MEVVDGYGRHANICSSDVPFNWHAILIRLVAVVTSSESPVVVVLSGSMEPAFHRGDILFLHMGFTPFRSGDIVVFKVQDREIPIVHRIIKVKGGCQYP